MRSQIEIAIAAALTLNLPLYWIFTRRDSLGRPNPLTLGEVGTLLLVLGCYLAVPYVVGSFRKQRVIRAIPIWLWVSFLGAALIVFADDALGITYGIRGGESFTTGWLGLSLFTLPSTSLVYYSRAIIGLVKKWHTGQRNYPSILRR
jgi:hypothetical protein